jgi:SAM-dependent methyltransferase
VKVQRIRQHYERRVNGTRPGYDILDWSSREAQNIRFDVLVQTMQRELAGASTPSLLDVGCGMADLAAYLEDGEVDVAYTGADITFKVVREALRRAPSRRLLLADVFSAAPFGAESFDVLFCSGVFNLKLGNNDDFVVRAVRAMIPLAREMVVVNMLHRRTATKYVHCHYFDPDEIASRISRPGLDVRVIDDYLENDFTVVVKV